MKPLILILISCLCATAQIVPPMVQPPVVVQHKIPTPQPIEILWSPSVNAISYNLEGETNGSLFLSTNIVTTNVIVWSWPGHTNGYLVQAVGSNGIGSTWTQITHSGWYIDTKLVLSVLTNNIVWSNVVCADISTLLSPSFFRTYVDDDVELQESGSIGFENSQVLFSSDIDNFPSIAEYRAVWVRYTLNIP